MDKARARLTYSLVAIVGFLTVCPVVMLALGSFSEGLTAFGRFTLGKYAGASRVTISMRARDGRVQVEVRDDGVGGADPAHGSGLRGLADRVEALGGTLQVDSPPGRGTRVTAELPLGRPLR